MSVEISNLTKIYGKQKAIDNISFKINTGEVVGFLGPNGAGKSTTLKILTGFLKPDSGTATINGIDIEQDPIQAKRKIGYLPESNPLYNEMYIREYLAFVAGIHQLKKIKERVEEVIEITGLALESNKKIGQVSKGYKQRTGIASALIHDPEVLLLDEPTSGLDPNQILEIRSLILKLAENKTILFSSHILQEVEAMCERVIIINKGKIVADNSLNQLKTSETGSQKVIVEFAEKVEENELLKLPSINHLNSTDGKKWEIVGSDSELIRRQLLQFSLQHSLNIVSLQSEKNSLEQVFKNLTS